MDFYHAVFQRLENEVSVFFPDLGLPEIVGRTWDEAYENAVVALSEWLAATDAQHHNEPSSYEEIRLRNHEAGDIIPVPVDKDIVKNLQKTRKFNVVFPETLLQRVDRFRESRGLRRSALLAEAVVEFMKKNEKTG